MSDVFVLQPPLIDAAGNINVHGLEGISIPYKLWDGDPRNPTTVQIDIHTFSIALRVDGVSSIPLVVDPDDAMGLLISVPSLKNAGIFVTPGNFPLFAILDTTNSVPLVRWEGRFIARGWEL